MTLSKKQQAARAQGIGASEIAVLVGFSNYSTPIEVWRRKIGADDDTDEASYSRDLGVEIEEPIARVWAKRQGKVIARVSTLQHPTKPLALATPDRAVFPLGWKPGRGPLVDLFGAESLLEVKSTNWRMAHAWGPEGTDEIPADYLCQAHWQGFVAGLDVVDFAVDFDKRTLKRYRVRVDHEFVGRLYEAAERFWTDHVLAGVPPAPDGTERYLEVLKRWHPKETTSDLVDASGPEHDETRQALFRLARVKALADRVELAEKFERARVLLAIGDKGGLTWPDADGPVVVTYKANAPSVRVDWESAAQDALTIAGLAIQSLPEGDTRAQLAADLQKIVPSRTSTVPGHRSLRFAKAPASWRFDEEDLAPLGLPEKPEKKKGGRALPANVSPK